jgi:protein-disulfide isomerase
MEPLDDAVDHVRGGSAGRLIVEYGDYECPYSRRAFREIEQVERRLGNAAARQDQFWNMHELLFHRQTALEDDDLRLYAAELELDVALFDSDRTGAAVLERIRRDVQSGMASGEVQGAPTLFIDGVVHRRGYDAATLLEALTGP